MHSKLAITNKLAVPKRKKTANWSRSSNQTTGVTVLPGRRADADRHARTRAGKGERAGDGTNSAVVDLISLGSPEQQVHHLGRLAGAVVRAPAHRAGGTGRLLLPLLAVPARRRRRPESREPPPALAPVAHIVRPHFNCLLLFSFVSLLPHRLGSRCTLYRKQKQRKHGPINIALDYVFPEYYSSVIGKQKKAR